MIQADWGCDGGHIAPAIHTPRVKAPFPRKIRSGKDFQLKGNKQKEAEHSFKKRDCLYKDSRENGRVRCEDCRFSLCLRFVVRFRGRYPQIFF